MLRRAFDRGITHFDLANNYGPPYGQAEINFGRIMATDFKPYRDELIISSKAGYDMWPGPYGQGGSRKYLIASCDQSLKRMGLDYVDIFYSHRFDPETPLEETMGALDRIVRSGRALYAGISSYDPKETERAATIARDLGTPLLIHQPRYNMFDRWIEDGLVDTCEQEGMGIICFSPLAQGILTDKYLRGVPAQSRAGMGAVSLRPDQIDDVTRAAIAALNEVAKTVTRRWPRWPSRGSCVSPALPACLWGLPRYHNWIRISMRLELPRSPTMRECVLGRCWPTTSSDLSRVVLLS